MTDAVLETVAEWQNRPRGVDMYPLVFFDVLRVKIRAWAGSQQGRLCRTRRHAREPRHPGLWIDTSEGAKFWLPVMDELKNSGVGDILIAVADGLKGFSRCDRRRVSADTCRPSFIRETAEGGERYPGISNLRGEWQVAKLSLQSPTRTLYRKRFARSGWKSGAVKKADCCQSFAQRVSSGLAVFSTAL